MKNMLWVVIAFALAFGCGDDDTSDTGVTDAGASDGGVTDASEDAGMRDDADSEDASAEDAGIDDAGSEDAVSEDTGPEPTCPDLMPTQGADNIIISQYNLATGEVEFYNPTDTALPLDGLELCSRPAYETITDSGIMVPPGGFATFLARASFRGANPSRGELALYDSTSYESRNSMIDFLCWGEELAPSRSRKHVAEMVEGEEVLWAGGCSDAPAMSVVARGEGNTGTGAADYVSDEGFALHICE